MNTKLSVRNYSLMLAGEFAAFGAGAVILLVFIASTLDASLLQNGQQAAVVTSVLADLANTDRGLNHLGSLTVNPKLTAIAQAKANDMANEGYFAHTSPEGKTPWYWFRQEGYTFTYAGENLAIDFSDSADVEEAWMKSPTHRANLLNGKFTEVGIATAVGTYQGRTTTFVVEEFATPGQGAASAPHAPVSTHTEIAAGPKPQASGTEPVPEVLSASVAPLPKSASTHATPLAVASDTPVAAATSTDVAVSRSAPDAPAPAAPAGFLGLWQDFAASPKTTLEYAYYLFALIILLALVIETGLEVHKRHLRHVALAVSLLVLMGGLFFTADRLVFTAPVLTEAVEAGVGA